MRIKTIIIDDESNARELLNAQLAKLDSLVEVVGEADGVETGIKIIEEMQPDLVMLDIKMNDGTGFDLLNKLSSRNFKLIFTTAYDQFAIKAFKYSAIDYLLKPINPLELNDAVESVSQMQTVENEQLNMVHQLNNNQGLSTIALSTREGVYFVEIKDIIRCEGDKGYCTFYTKDQQEIMVSKPLVDYEKILADHMFYRVHQSHLINLKEIKMVQRNDGGNVVMKDGSNVPIARRKKNEFFKIMQIS